LKPRDGEQFLISYKQAYLSPPGMADQKPWAQMDQDLRDQVDGIMVLKMTFTAEDLALFPRLKVYVNLRF
jgi:C-terminal binding protein